MQHGIAIDDHNRHGRVAAALERLLEPDMAPQVLMQSGPQLLVEGNRIQAQQATWDNTDGVPERDTLRMNESEIAAVLEEGGRAQVATYNSDGSIHLVPMSYVVYDGRVTLWTDPASRKVANLRADPRLTCLIELGEDFQSFRAVQLVGTGSLITDYDGSKKVGEALFARSVGTLTDDMLGYVASLAAQRVGIVVQPERVVSWDHRKLIAARPDQIGN